VEKKLGFHVSGTRKDRDKGDIEINWYLVWFILNQDVRGYLGATNLMKDMRILGSHGRLDL